MLTQTIVFILHIVHGLRLMESIINNYYSSNTIAMIFLLIYSFNKTLGATDGTGKEIRFALLTLGQKAGWTRVKVDKVFRKLPSILQKIC